MEHASDRALVAALKRGDRRAFDQVYAAFRPRVFGFLARMLGRTDVAEDLLQETWLRLASGAPALADDTRLGPWLFTVARNLCVSHHRWRRLDAERLAELSLSRPGDPVDTPFEQVAASETERRLERALSALSPKYREVVLLVAVERLRPADVAEVLGLRGDTVRQRLARARAMLDDALRGPAAKARAPGERTMRGAP